MVVGLFPNASKNIYGKLSGSNSCSANSVIACSISIAFKIYIPLFYYNLYPTNINKCLGKVKIEKDILRLDVSPVQVAQLFDLDPVHQDCLEIKETVQWQMNGKGYTLLINNRPVSTNSASSEALKRSVIKALAWNQGLMDGTIKSIRQIEKEKNLNSSYIRRTLPSLSTHISTIFYFHKK